MGQPRSSTVERRRSSRFDKVIPVYLTSETGICRGIARNISAGGMFIEARDPQPLGARVTVSFADEATGIEMSVVAEVRYHVAIEHGSQKGRSKLRGMGVRFLRFHARDDRLFLPPGSATLH